MKLQKYNNNILQCNIGCFINDDNEIYFRGKDVAAALGYNDTDQAIRVNVEDDDKDKLEHLFGPLQDSGLTFNEKNSIYINESGLYSLVLRSNKEEAKQFKQWITKEVLPSIRKTGTYSTIIPTCKQLSLMNEQDLHYKVVDWIRKYIQEPIIIPGLGEHQKTNDIRHDAWKKGYSGGQPDIILLNCHSFYKGLCLEFKTPNGRGVLSDNQSNYLNILHNNNFLTLVSNDYDEIVMELMKYKTHIRYICKYCLRKPKQFISVHSRDNHYKYFHKIN